MPRLYEQKPVLDVSPHVLRPAERLSHLPVPRSAQGLMVPVRICLLTPRRRAAALRPRLLLSHLLLPWFLLLHRLHLFELEHSAGAEQQQLARRLGRKQSHPLWQ
jgi:hypothetical protein